MRSSQLKPSFDLLTPKQKLAVELMAGPQRHTLLWGGARAGKTALIVRTLFIRAMRHAGSRHAIFRHRLNAVRATIGAQTIPFVISKFFPGLVLSGEDSLGRRTFPNGSELWLCGLDDKERVEKVLGGEFASLYFNECSQIPWASAELALSRLAQNIPGLQQRAYYDLNPAGNRHWTYRQFIEGRRAESNAELPDPENYKKMQINPEDNREHLTDEYMLSLQRGSAKAVARFYRGEYVPEIEGALWTLELIERQRIDFAEMPTLAQIVVAVDPSGAKGPDDTRSNAIGIVAAGKARTPDPRSFVLRDATMVGSPAQWAKVVCDLYDELGADAIVAEQNYGGEMVRHTIKTANPNANVRLVVASRGKHIRAEPISAEYETGNVFHVRAPLDPDGGHKTRLRWGQSPEGRFDLLEDELCNMATHGYQGPTSPNRLDALVWAGNDLFGKSVVRSDAVIEISQQSIARRDIASARLS